MAAVLPSKVMNICWKDSEVTVISFSGLTKTRQHLVSSKAALVQVRPRLTEAPELPLQDCATRHCKHLSAL